jgi:hypothetical protein
MVGVAGFCPDILVMASRRRLPPISLLLTWVSIEDCCSGQVNDRGRHQQFQQMCGQQPDGPLACRVGENIGGTRAIREEEMNRDKLAYDVVNRPILIVLLHGQLLHRNFNIMIITNIFPYTGRAIGTVKSHGKCHAKDVTGAWQVYPSFVFESRLLSP